MNTSSNDLIVAAKEHRSASHNLLEILAVAVSVADWGACRETHAAIARQVLEHTDFEEMVLFPLLQRQRSNRDPFSPLKDEHSQLFELVCSLGEEIARKDPSGCTSAIARIESLLRRHDDKEMQFVYSSLEELLEGRELERAIGYFSRPGQTH